MKVSEFSLILKPSTIVTYLDSGICIAARDIKKGEEILMNYNDMDEPEETKEGYYKK